MPRPRKGRRICAMPDQIRFGPMDKKVVEEDFIQMMVDEYEVIRLIDFEGLNQSECAEQMKVARTTVQRIYNDARRKLAEVIVNGKALKIEGGDYILCTEKNMISRYGRCRGRWHQQSTDEMES